MSFRPNSTFRGPRKPLPPFSKKRLAEHEARALISAQVRERDNDRCRAIGLIPGHTCSGQRHAHEIDKRSRKPGCHVWEDLDGYLWICDGANGWVEDHPIEAHDLGLARWSWESKDSPAGVPSTGGDGTGDHRTDVAGCAGRGAST